MQDSYLRQTLLNVAWKPFFLLPPDKTQSGYGRCRHLKYIDIPAQLRLAKAAPDFAEIALSGQ